MLKNWKGWRTLAVNAAIALANVVVIFQWSDVLDPKVLVYVNGIGIPVVNFWLRYITTTPVLKGE